MLIELPGWFDIQVNGFAGVDFNDPDADDEEILLAAVKLRRTGVTSFLPTVITSSVDRFSRCVKKINRLKLPGFCGFHMEGPYISAEDGPRGAHNREYVSAASIEDFSRRQEISGGWIRLVTLAPEVPGALPLIEHLVKTGIRVAIGHTAATSQQIAAAVSAGATLSTHLGNGCHLQMSRHPNVIWDQLANEHLTASLIADGHHLPPEVVKVMIRAKGTNRIILTTDAMAAAGCGPGNYQLNDLLLTVNPDGRVSQPGKPWLAGSSLTMDRCVANVVKYTGLAIETVWGMASHQPAAFFGVKPVGRIIADWDENNFLLKLREVIE
jgi:N-acetylglucosamine-6-phosphate deacetylase